MKNQKHTTVLVHVASQNFTYFDQIRGNKRKKHLESEIAIERARYKQLVKQILKLKQ